VTTRTRRIRAGCISRSAWYESVAGSGAKPWGRLSMSSRPAMVGSSGRWTLPPDALEGSISIGQSTQREPRTSLRILATRTLASRRAVGLNARVRRVRTRSSRIPLAQVCGIVQPQGRTWIWQASIHSGVLSLEQMAIPLPWGGGVHFLGRSTSTSLGHPDRTYRLALGRVDDSLLDLIDPLLDGCALVQAAFYPPTVLSLESVGAALIAARVSDQERATRTGEDESQPDLPGELFPTLSLSSDDTSIWVGLFDV
jgi:hypothetical protein